jgi:hypothetical protein
MEQCLRWQENEGHETQVVCAQSFATTQKNKNF